VFPISGTSIEELLHFADTELYKMKVASDRPKQNRRASSGLRVYPAQRELLDRLPGPEPGANSERPGQDHPFPSAIRKAPAKLVR
jgi:hypothetical protein